MGSEMCIRDSKTLTHLPAGIEGVRTHASISLLRMSTAVGCLASNGDWRSRSLKKHLKFERTRMDGTGLSRRELATLLINQLMTPYFSGGSTLSGTPGGDRWAGVLGGQIVLLSEPLHRVDADCSESTKKSAPPKTHRETHTSPATATTSRQRATTKLVPRANPYILARFHRFRVCGNRPRTALAISKNDECYTQTGGRTDRLIK